MRFSFLETFAPYLFVQDAARDKNRVLRSLKAKEEEQRLKGPKIHPDDTVIMQAFARGVGPWPNEFRSGSGTEDVDPDEFF